MVELSNRGFEDLQKGLTGILYSGAEWALEFTDKREGLVFCKVYDPAEKNPLSISDIASLGECLAGYVREYGYGVSKIKTHRQQNGSPVTFDSLEYTLVEISGLSGEGFSTLYEPIPTE